MKTKRHAPKTSIARRDHRPGDRPLPGDPDHRNPDRARWAAVALEAFRRETGADLEDALSDLLADCMHWCDRSGQKFEHELRRALGHYQAETSTRG